MEVTAARSDVNSCLEFEGAGDGVTVSVGVWAELSSDGPKPEPKSTLELTPAVSVCVVTGNITLLDCTRVVDTEALVREGVRPGAGV